MNGEPRLPNAITKEWERTARPEERLRVLLWGLMYFTCRVSWWLTVPLAVLVDQLKSMDWAGRRARFHSKVEPALLTTVRQYVAVLLGIR